FFRYHSESRSSFHRALKELVATLQRDAAELVDGEGSISPDEPDSRCEGPETMGAGDAILASCVALAGSIPPNGPGAPVHPNEPGAAVDPNEPGEPKAPNEPKVEAKESVGSLEKTKISDEKSAQPTAATVAETGSEEGRKARYAALEREV